MYLSLKHELPKIADESRDNSQHLDKCYVIQHLSRTQSFAGQSQVIIVLQNCHSIVPQ